MLIFSKMIPLVSRLNQQSFDQEISRSNITQSTVYEFSQYVVNIRQCYMKIIQPWNRNSQEGILNIYNYKFSLSLNGIWATGNIMYGFIF